MRHLRTSQRLGIKGDEEAIFCRSALARDGDVSGDALGAVGMLSRASALLQVLRGA